MVNTEDKFQEIYEEYKNLVLKSVHDMTGDFHLAQDICQETFLRLHGYQDNIIVSKVKGWLLVVSSHLVYDYMKKASSRREILTDGSRDSDTGVIDDQASIYLEQAEQKQLCSSMLRALREKNEDWYEVLMLVEYLGVPRKVVARKRGVSLSTIDNYLRKSKKWMKANFQKEYEEF